MTIETYDDYVSINNVKFYFDYQDGKYGWNSSSLRGADTFSPFKQEIQILPTEYSSWNSVTVDMKTTLSDYASLTVDNFILIATKNGTNIAAGRADHWSNDALTKTYNDGILKVSAAYMSNRQCNWGSFVYFKIAIIR